MRAWYLRRAVPWAALLGCAGCAVLVALLIERWPATSLMLLPMMLACCVAAAAFAFDERALAVVEVTPRGGTWRRQLRLAVGLTPVAAWLGAVWLRPGELPLDLVDWGLVGVGAVLAGVATAGLLSTREVSAPGGVLAPWVVLGLCAPVVVSMFLGVDPVYPYDAMGGVLRGFWIAVATAGGVAAVATTRPGVRR